MSEFEFNKIFAAILVAGITIWFSAFLVDHVIFPHHHLEKDAITVEGGAVESAGPAKVELPEPIMGLLAAADVEKGKKLSKACAACHSFDQGGAHKVGPNLWNVVNGTKGNQSGFSYSNALLEHGGVWSYSELNYFLWKPKKHIAGTKMNYIGLKKPQDRAAMIAWLRTLASDPSAFPNDAEIQEEVGVWMEATGQAVEEEAVDPVVEEVFTDPANEAEDLSESVEEDVQETLEEIQEEAEAAIDDVQDDITEDVVEDLSEDISEE